MRMARSAIVFMALFVGCAIGAAQRQGEVASKTVAFGTIAKSDAAYQKARDAHDLDGAYKALGESGSFKGTVAQLYKARDGDLAILDFEVTTKVSIFGLRAQTTFWAECSR
jgi:hypothetical protein